jgi:chromatin structure-remodeling complex subunit RSC1/2
LREILAEELNKLVEKGHITASDAQLPDLGELPPAEESPPVEDDNEDEDNEDEDDDEDEDDEDEDEDDSDDEGGRRRGRKRRASARKDQDKDYEDDSHKRRGRPPSVLTPNEARIASLLKGLRKLRDNEGNLLIHPFERLPDKATVPDYYTTIPNPIALDNIKKKAKRKKYQSIDHALQDLNLMFENAKRYNEDDSEVYKAAIELEKQASLLAEQEKAKPDDDFRDEDGKLPLAEIEYNGQTWKIGRYMSM